MEEEKELNMRNIIALGLIGLVFILICAGGGLFIGLNLWGGEREDIRQQVFTLHPEGVLLPNQETDYRQASVKYEVPKPISEVAAWYREQLSEGYTVTLDLVDPVHGGILRGNEGTVDITLRFFPLTEETSEFSVLVSPINSSSGQEDESQTGVEDGPAENRVQPLGNEATDEDSQSSLDLSQSSGAGGPESIDLEGEEDPDAALDLDISGEDRSISLSMVGADELYAGSMQRFIYEISLRGSGFEVLTITLPFTQVHLLDSENYVYNKAAGTIVLHPEGEAQFSIPVLTELWAGPGQMTLKVLAQDEEGGLYLEALQSEIF